LSSNMDKKALFVGRGPAQSLNCEPPQAADSARL